MVPGAVWPPLLIMKGGPEVMYLVPTAQTKLAYPTSGEYLNTQYDAHGEYFAGYMLVDLYTSEFMGPEDVDLL